MEFALTLPFSPAELDALRQNEPDKYIELVSRLARELSRDVVENQRREAMAAIVRAGDKFENYLPYHELIHGTPLDAHLVEPIRISFEAHARGEKFLFLGFRGSRKTTTELTIDTFLIGHHPEGTGVITGASDNNAVKNAKFIAQTIESHPEFARVFPYVKPREKTWGADGYWVIDSRMTEEEWRRKQASVIDPTFIGGGYKSASINGKHPTLFLTVDDLHDIDSSASTTEREYIKTVFFTQILKTVIRKNDKMITRVDVTGVPFAKDDSYAQMRNAGDTTFYILPVMKKAADGQGVYIDGINPKTGVVYEDIVGWWILAWPENFGMGAVVNARSEGKGAFWQMFMLDINMAKQGGLKYYLYPDTEIGFDLPTAGGADPTNTDPDFEVGGNKRSSFALAYVCKLLRGGLVLKDGVLKPMGFMGCKDAMLQAQTMFTNWMTTGVENVGPGKAFMQFLRLFPGVKFIDSNIIDPKGGIKDKRTRIEAELSPWLENGVLKISDAPTEYNKAVREGLDNFFELDFKKPNPAIDALDGLYHAVKRFPEVLREYASSDISPQGMNQRGGLWHPLMGGRPNGANYGRN